jgi:hypothetical protein
MVFRETVFNSYKKHKEHIQHMHSVNQMQSRIMTKQAVDVLTTVL